MNTNTEARPAPTAGDGATEVLTRTGGTVELDAAVVAELTEELEGEIVLPDDPSYDVERRVWNGMIDVSPAVVVKCASTADVAATISFVRRHDLQLSVRGGGHNAAGVAVREQGVVIDMSAMKAIDVDPERRVVRADGGVLIGELDAATQAHGLAVPQGVVTETGIGGLTLGGGFGWLRRRYGLACDNLIGAEVVTADGRIVRTSEDERPELLWGLRGGGGNFGIVTSFEFRAHPLGPEVFFSVVFHAAEAIADGLRFFDDWSRRAPDDISALAVLWHAPQIDEIPAEHHGRPALAFVAMHAGSPAEGEAALADLRRFGSPIADLSSVMPFLDVQQFFDEDYPKWEKRYYWTSSYVDGLDDALIDELIALNAGAPSHESTIDVWQLGGAMARVPAAATAFGDRSAAFMLGIEANWDAAEDDAVNMRWARDVREAASPWATGARYANFPGLYEDEESPDFFGADNRDRLAALKAEWDPTNLFDRNHNIAPQSDSPDT